MKIFVMIVKTLFFLVEKDHKKTTKTIISDKYVCNMFVIFFYLNEECLCNHTKWISSKIYLDYFEMIF